MNPVAFEIFNIEIRWYGILIASGVLIGTFIAMREARRKGIDEELLLDLLLFAVPAALLGGLESIMLYLVGIYIEITL